MAGGGNRASLTSNLPSLADAIEAVAKQHPKEVRKVLREEVKEVAAVVRRNIRAETGAASKARRSSRRRAGLTVSKTRAAGAPMYGATSRAAWVGYNRKNPYIGWLDFGGKLEATNPIPPKKRGRTNAIVRDVLRPGRYLYPAILEQRPKTAERLAGELEQILNANLPR
jgi:hypothetical protein